MKQTSILETITAVLVFLFLYTAVSKYLAFDTFQFFVAQAPLLQNNYKIVAYVLPAIEIGVVILLIFPKTRLKGLYASTLLLILFTVYLIGMVLFAKNLPCGCGGVLNTLTWKQHIFLNLFFLAIAIAGSRLQKKKSTLEKEEQSNLSISNT